MADDDVQLTDLEVIQRYSLAVRGATASRADLVAALQADLSWLQGTRRAAPGKAAAAKAVRARAAAAPAEAPAPADDPAPAGDPPLADGPALANDPAPARTASKAPVKKAPTKTLTKAASTKRKA